MYKQGQKLVCVNDKPWTHYTNEPVTQYPTPDKDEIVTYDGETLLGYLFLKEYDYLINGVRVRFAPESFVPVQDNRDESVVKELATKHVLVPEKLDVIGVPETVNIYK